MNEKKIFQNTIIEFIFRLLIGTVFIYASFHKIGSPGEFAKIIYGYQLFPNSLINIMAIAIPFLELTCGVCLVIGILPRGAVSILNLMLIGFIIAITINLIRGHEFDCGCFAVLQQKSSPKLLLIRDVTYLFMGIYIFLFPSFKRILWLKKA